MKYTLSKLDPNTNKFVKTKDYEANEPQNETANRLQKIFEPPKWVQRVNEISELMESFIDENGKWKIDPEFLKATKKIIKMMKPVLKKNGQPIPEPRDLCEYILYKNNDLFGEGIIPNIQDLKEYLNIILVEYFKELNFHTNTSERLEANEIRLPAPLIWATDKNVFRGLFGELKRMGLIQSSHDEIAKWCNILLGDTDVQIKTVSNYVKKGRPKRNGEFVDASIKYVKNELKKLEKNR
jgi:hypothetical protein